ncbi:hypothetical protein BHE90_009963 [Fusarium euwallaceae]|uniref:Uncharacterized protein n=1 Tax=Fusarium euwallaceae TaxID=1147111 RepID=A0A430LIL7_9HYPO|nr:hypothetical protein BHE90_009963 [Fusarium euwallaceae]
MRSSTEIVQPLLSEGILTVDVHASWIQGKIHGQRDAIDDAGIETNSSNAGTLLTPMRTPSRVRGLQDGNPTSLAPSFSRVSLPCRVLT